MPLLVEPSASFPAAARPPTAAVPSSLAWSTLHSQGAQHCVLPIPEASRTLPDAYIWPEELRPNSQYQGLEPVDIPVVDLGDLQSEQEPSCTSVVEKIACACENWGLFYVVNHGVPEQLVRSVREQGYQLFSLPLDQKMKAHRPDGGLAGYGKAIIGKFFDSLMWSEGFTMIGAPNSCVAELTSKLWPDGGNESRIAFEEYDIALRKLAVELMRVIMVGMKVHLNRFQSKQFDLQACQGGLQLNHYPPCPEPKMTLGLAAHTDSTCLTILHQGDVAGLEMYRNGKWIAVPPVKDSFVVHVGDMLQIISNGKYKSTLHRAVVNESKARLSLAYLCGPPPTATITPACELITSQSPPLYRPLTWKEYLQAKCKYFVGALQTFTYA